MDIQKKRERLGTFNIYVLGEFQEEKLEISSSESVRKPEYTQ